MPTPTDYVALATAAAEAAPEVETPAAPAAAAPQALEATPPAEGAPAAAADPEVKPVSRVEKSFEDLAREKVALRAEREKIKAEGASLGSSRALAEAAKRGDAMALLAAAGIPWSKAAQQVLEGSGVKIPEQDDNTPDPRDQRLAALEQEIASNKAQAIRSNLMSQLQARTKADPAKFRLTSGLNAEHEAIAYIEQYFRETGELPGSDIGESMEIALEAVETHYTKESKRWGPLLTPLSGAVTVPVSKSAVPAVGAVSQQAPKTLTNNVGSGPSAPSASKKLKTDADYQRAAIEALTAQ